MSINCGCPFPVWCLGQDMEFYSPKHAIHFLDIYVLWCISSTLAKHLQYLLTCPAPLTMSSIEVTFPLCSLSANVVVCVLCVESQRINIYLRPKKTTRGSTNPIDPTFQGWLCNFYRYFEKKKIKNKKDYSPTDPFFVWKFLTKLNEKVRIATILH